jgi:hypothetical protein
MIHNGNNNNFFYYQIPIFNNIKISTIPFLLLLFSFYLNNIIIIVYYGFIKVTAICNTTKKYYIDFYIKLFGLSLVKLSEFENNRSIISR